MSASKDVRASPFSGKGASFIHLQRWLMMLGKTKAALQYLFWKADEGVLNLDDCIPATNVPNGREYSA